MITNKIGGIQTRQTHKIHNLTINSQTTPPKPKKTQNKPSA